MTATPTTDTTLQGTGRAVAMNVVSRMAALAALGIATILVARIGGAADVGVYALLRVLPGLVAVLAAGGLPGAAPFFLAGPTRDHPRLWATIVALTLLGGTLGAAVWAAAAPLLRDLFFHTLSVGLVALAGVTVFTQLLMTVGKVCLQGVRDDRGSNLVIATEEIAFLPPYLVGLALHADGVLNILVALAVADLAVAAQAWGRMARRGAVRGSLRPSVALARRIVGYGVRGQVGGVMTLLNLRFDFAILGALVSPAVLGTYAIASKYAELLRLPGLAVTWVVYPRVARGGGVPGAALRRLLPRALALGVACAIPLALAAGVVLPLLYGEDFSASVVPAYILIGGLVGEVAAGLATAYLYGAGRPGLNSIAMAVGVAVTVVLDLLLIPRYGATGAAVASAATYLLADGLLVLMMLRHSARHGVAASGALVPAPGAPAP